MMAFEFGLNESLLLELLLSATESCLIIEMQKHHYLATQSFTNPSSDNALDRK